MANSDKAMAICTSTGFRAELTTDYISAAGILEPDIFIAPADIPNAEKWGNNRTRKMFERTGLWLEAALAAKTSSIAPSYALFAPVIALPEMPQRMFLKEAAENAKVISGLAVHASTLPADLPEALVNLPRLFMNTIHSPAEVLNLISDGIDLFSAQFINLASDAGLALTFRFPAPAMVESANPAPLAMDMWPVDEHSVSVEPLLAECQCLACTQHHRAYVQHLLAAKEMYGWVLLQIHNYQVFDRFLEGVRASIAEGTAKFEADKAAFESFYEQELPSQTGKGPR
jgi:queuine tRNA-ribosyltransferase subunit QTRTD1